MSTISPVSVFAAEPCWIGVGCNVESSCMAWEGSFLAYAAGSSVALLSPSRGAIVATFSCPGPVLKVLFADTYVVLALCSSGVMVADFTAQPSRPSKAVLSYCPVNLGQNAAPGAGRERCVVC